MTFHEFLELTSEIESELTTPESHNRIRHDERVKKTVEALKNVKSAELKDGCTVIRLIGVNLGTSRYRDIHDQINWVTVKKFTDKTVIGTYRERVPRDRIVIVLED